MINEKYGVWTSNGKKFDNSYDAFLNASKFGGEVDFSYHHNIFSRVDVSLLGKIPLNILYKDRAQQLRDKYNYLILYYSGGADSHNILRTFIDNGIKLDEICIKWPKPLLEGKFYTPNTFDNSAKNYWSEWDYAIKPTLNWIAKNKPDIKITFKDYIGHPDQLNIDNLFSDTSHHGFMAGILLNSQVSDSEFELIKSGKTVGNIYGLDKPFLVLIDNKIYMFFMDTSLRTCVRSVINPYGAECFYWTPDIPLIAFEQAYQVSLHYKANKEDRKYLFDLKLKGERNIVKDQLQMQNEISKKYIYTTWDYRFQSNKPTSDARLDKFYWFFEQPELNRPKEIFFDNVNQRLSSIKPQFLTSEFTNSMKSFPSLKTRNSPRYYIGDLDD